MTNNIKLFDEQQKDVEFYSVDISENIIRQEMPEILNILLIDRTTSTAKNTKNIIWANNNYIHYGPILYAENSCITADLITGDMGGIIMPRVLKSLIQQKERTKSQAEVFTPTWIVKKQNEIIDKNYKKDSLETYVSRKWLEITCGEAPYMVSRYDMETGKIIPINERVGFIDLKLKRISKEIDDKDEWIKLVIKAFQASYGFEWNGDSLLLARENILSTFYDYYLDKWKENPSYDLFKQIAEIISYNVFQMDGLKYIVPLSEKPKVLNSNQYSLFEQKAKTVKKEKVIMQGKKVKIMNWKTNKMEVFTKGVKKND